SEGKEFGKAGLGVDIICRVKEENTHVKNEGSIIVEFSHNMWRLASGKIDGVIPQPGTYTIHFRYRDKEINVGEVQFLYRKFHGFSVEQLRAIESDPYSVKNIRAVLGCKFCPTELLAYCSLERNINEEDEGYTWYQDLPDTFNCECG